MYRLIIADDEDFILEQLIEMLSWTEFEFDVVAAFEDGSEVIDFLKDNQVDVVLADIKMKNTSGLEVAKYIHENEINTEVILISGYKDFEYARQAIQYDVFDYLCKPTTYSDITTTFKRLYEYLNVKYDTEINQLAKKQLFFDILSGLEDTELLQQGLKKLKINIDVNNMIASIVTTSFSHYNEYIEGKWKYGKEGFHNAIHNIVDTVEGGLYCSVVDMVYSEAIVLVIGTNINEEQFACQIEKYVSDIKNNLEQNLNIAVKCTAHEVCHSIQKIADSYKRIMSNSKHHIMALTHNIISHVTVGNTTGALSILNSFMNGCNELKEAHTFANHFAITAKQILKVDIHQLENAESIDGVANILADTIRMASQMMGDKNFSQMDMAIAYIHENYGSDISLGDVASHVALSPVYFSRYFKQHTGERFVDYITNVRIEKAKILLSKTDLKVYEICSQVGYKNIQHFHRLFKNTTHSTPNEYRIQRGGKHG